MASDGLTLTRFIPFNHPNNPPWSWQCKGPQGVNLCAKPSDLTSRVRVFTPQRFNKILVSRGLDIHCVKI